MELDLELPVSAPTAILKGKGGPVAVQGSSPFGCSTEAGLVAPRQIA